jgi:hypothetical protein
MVAKRRGVLVALIIGSIVGGTGSATIMSAAASSRATHEKTETAQREAFESAPSPAATAGNAPVGS